MEKFCQETWYQTKIRQRRLHILTKNKLQATKNCCSAWLFYVVYQNLSTFTLMGDQHNFKTLPPLSAMLVLETAGIYWLK
jgi:hypothetical protein